MKLKPTRPGMIIRDPQTTRPLPDEGAEVPDSSYWRRRLADGDVSPVTDEPAPAVKKPVKE